MRFIRLVVILVAVLAAAQIYVAQSGRRKTPAPSPSPSPATPTPTGTTSNKPSPTPAQTGTAFHPKAFIVTGKTKLEGGTSYGSDDVGDVRDEIKFMFEFLKLPAQILKGGKMTREQAIARAKQETGNYVVWMEIKERMDVDTANLRTIITVEHVDYVLLMPGTGEVVRQFTVDPKKIVQTNEHGTPLPPRTKGRTTDLDNQLRRCAWEMARVLEYWL
jgi:hypothetical protein